jgi:hypothetical protein
LDGQPYAGGDSDIFLIKYLGDGTKVWTTLSGTTATDVAVDVSADSVGNIYMVGSTEGDLDGKINAGFSDIFLMKYYPNGTKAWTALSGTTGDDYGNSVTIDSSGHIYVSGESQGDLDGNANAGGADIVLMKYFENGTKAWTRLYGSTGGDAGVSASLDSYGGIYMVGYTDGDLDDQTNGGNLDAFLFLMKCFENGTKAWTRLSGSSFYEEAYAVDVDSWGNIYVAGYTDGDLDDQINAAKDAAILLMKYFENGTKAWTRLAGSLGADIAFGVSVDSADSIYVVGYTENGLSGTTAGGADSCLIKYDTNGTQLSTALSGGESDDNGLAISIDSSDNIYVVGVTYGSMDEEPFAGGLDVFVMKYSYLDVSLPPSMAPTSTPTAAIDIDSAKPEAILSLTLHKFSRLDLAVVVILLICVCLLLFWVSYIRHTVAISVLSEANDDALKDVKKQSDSSKALPADGIMDFTMWSYAKPLLSCCCLASSLSQAECLLADGYAWNAYVILGCYAIPFTLSLLLQCLIFGLLCFGRFSDLSLRLHPKALSQGRLLWPLVSLLSVSDLYYFCLFPWINNQFCARSDGFPTLRVFLFVHVSKLIQSAGIAAALTTTASLNLLQFLSLCSSLIILVLSMYTLCIKMLYGNIGLYEVVVVSKEFAERALSADITLKNTMSVDLPSESNPVEAPPIDIDRAAEEQQDVHAALDNLRKRRESRALSSDQRFSTREPYADKTIEILKQQVMHDYRGKPLEYIPLSIIKAELAQLMKAAAEGAPFDEGRLDHLIRCMEYNDEYIAQKQEEERQWNEGIRALLTQCLQAMRLFVPVNIASMTLAEIESAGLSRGLAKRIMTKRCLWLIRMSQSDIAKMHVADLSGKYHAEAQNLDAIEMGAIYGWLLDVSFEGDVGGVKRKIRDSLKRGLKEKMGQASSFDELMKRRNVAYKDQTGPFTDIDALFVQEVVSSEDPFAPRPPNREVSFLPLRNARGTKGLLEDTLKSNVRNADA